MALSYVLIPFRVPTLVMLGHLINSTSSLIVQAQQEIRWFL
ncbi:hypothetical protein LMG28138_00789 [Pararobbsia alpina]|uniref:Uncharacterized protein n=1 Tax=Pararobbsia alpina TaxID=621374 RepID=A0A6S7AVH6_9BURK|nr:hypothetical protein LMG28138_00789 [Pararobbsia alpina]